MKKQTNTHTEKQFGTIIGIDLGDSKHFVCVTDKNGDITEEISLLNRSECFLPLTEKYPGALIAIECGTHSPWISRLLTSLGASVIVAHARKLRAIYTNDRKCDQYDARMLAKLARVDPELLHPIKHNSEESQRDFLSIKLRDSLVRQRVNLINTVRFTLKSLGLRIHSSSTPAFATTARKQLADDTITLTTIEPCLKVIDEINAQIKTLDKKIESTIEENHPAAKHLRQIPGVGPVTALSFVLAVEDPNRIEDPRDTGAYFGLVPRRDQSGETDKQLPISKGGNQIMRRLLVQCAQYIMGHFGPDCDLKRYGQKLAARGGKAAKKKAVIAVARKLSVLMLVMWKTNNDYDPLKNAAAIELSEEAEAVEQIEAGSEEATKAVKPILEVTAGMG